MSDFLHRERIELGWRFVLLWVLMTNLGFFAGMAIEWLLLGRVNNYLSVPLAGIAQSWVLGRHLPERGAWAVATAVGWLVGGLATGWLLAEFFPELQFVAYIFAYAFLAGAAAGVPQWWVLRRLGLPVGWWWILVSSLAWGIQFPGLVTGLFLVRLLSKRIVTSQV